MPFQFTMKKNNVVASILLILLSHFSALASSQASNSTWLTLNGSAPLVIAKGGSSGLFPDSSLDAFTSAMATSVPDVVLWCQVQLTKDEVGICFPNIKLDNSSNIKLVYPQKENTYNVNGVPTRGYFSIDFTLKELEQVFLRQGIFSRDFLFDGVKPIQTVDHIFTQIKPQGFWLNIQHNTFYSQHNLSMRNFVINITKTVNISHISSAEVNFLRSLVRPFAKTKTKLVFQFLDQDGVDPSTNMTYSSLLKNLTFIKTFASGILVPKAYIWPIDSTSYLLPHTSLVQDAHKIGLQVFASDFANDFTFAYNYSYNPVLEYLSFIDNGNFSVDGVLSDFPITASEARDCFAHIDKNASEQAKPLIISHWGSSGDFPPCTDLSYTKAIKDGANVIDCPVQMSKDGVPFCLSSINLMNSTQVGKTKFRDLITTINEIQPNPGIFSFSMNWADIQDLTPAISNQFANKLLYRNPKYKNAGKLLSLTDFLQLAKNATSLSGVLIKIENAKYLAAKQGLSVTKAVLKALDKAGYNKPRAKNVMIQSTSSSILKAMKGNNYEFVYEVDETINSALNTTILDIKTFANSVVINKDSIFQIVGEGYLATMTNIVSQLQSFKLQVYVQIFQNEFVTIAFDFFSDPIVEINTFVVRVGIDGVITEFPQTAVAYKKNQCLKMKTTPSYMTPIRAGKLIQQINPELMPPSQAPNPPLQPDDVLEPPLPPAVRPNATAAPPRTTPPSGGASKIVVTANLLLSCMALACLFWLSCFD